MILKINHNAHPVTQGFDDCSDVAISINPQNKNTEKDIVYWSDVVKLYHEFKKMWGSEANRLEQVFLGNYHPELNHIYVPTNEQEAYAEMYGTKYFTEYALKLKNKLDEINPNIKYVDYMVNNLYKQIDGKTYQKAKRAVGYRLFSIETPNMSSYSDEKYDETIKKYQSEFLEKYIDESAKTFSLLSKDRDAYVRNISVYKDATSDTDYLVVHFIVRIEATFMSNQDYL